MDLPISALPNATIPLGGAIFSRSLSRAKLAVCRRVPLWVRAGIFRIARRRVRLVR